MSLDFLITALVVVLIPGTGVVYTVAVGLARGRRAALAASFGCTLGIIPAILASILGLAALLHTSALVYQGVKYAGVVYLLYLAWQTLRDNGPLRFKPDGEKRSGRIKTARTGFLINILNPKLSVFFLAFLPQFVSAEAAHPTLEMLTLAGTFMAMTFVVFAIYGWFASLVGRKILGSETVMVWMRRTVAAAFAGFGLRLALSDR